MKNNISASFTVPTTHHYFWNDSFSCEFLCNRFHCFRTCKHSLTFSLSAVFKKYCFFFQKEVRRKKWKIIIIYDDLKIIPIIFTFPLLPASREVLISMMPQFPMFWEKDIIILILVTFQSSMIVDMNAVMLTGCRVVNGKTEKDPKQYSISRPNMRILTISYSSVQSVFWYKKEISSGDRIEIHFENAFFLHGFFFVWSNSSDIFFFCFHGFKFFLLFSCSTRLLLSLFIQGVFRPFKKAKTNTILFTDIEKNANFHYYYYIYIHIIRVHITVLLEFRPFHSQLRYVYVYGILDKLTQNPKIGPNIFGKQWW